MYKKWKSLSQPIKLSVAFVVSSFILKGINFITTPVFTRFMDMEQYGIISTYNAWSSIIDIIACLGMTSVGIINVGINENSTNIKKYLASMLGLCNTFTCIAFAIILVIQACFNNPIQLNNKLILLMFVHLIFNPAQIFWITCERYEYRYKLATGITIGAALFGQILSLIAVVLNDGDLGTVKLWYTEVGTLLFNVPIYIYILVSGKKFIDLKIWKKTLLTAIPLLPHYLSQHILTSADKIMIAEFYTTSEVAVYSLVITISSIATLFWNSINASLMPYTFHALNEKKGKNIGDIANKVLLIYTVICVLVAMVAPEILRILGPAEYQVGIFAIPPILGIALLDSMYKLFSNIEFYYKKYNYIAVATVIAAIVNVLLNLLLIPKFNFVGAAYSTLISNCLLTFLHYVGYCKSTQIKVYRIRFIVGLVGIGLAGCFLCNLLYRSNTLRYIFLVSIVVVVWFKRKRIEKGIKVILLEKESTLGGSTLK